MVGNITRNIKENVDWGKLFESRDTFLLSDRMISFSLKCVSSLNFYFCGNNFMSYHFLFFT